jgi:hypothetical protein
MQIRDQGKVATINLENGIMTVVDEKTGEKKTYILRRTAEWLKLGNEVVCSSCWHSEGKYKYKEYKWCPYCGAKIIQTEGRQ